MSAHEVLEQLLAERRALLQTIADIACRAMGGDADERALHECADTLRDRMLAYTDLEDALLPGVLAESDAWGEIRVNRMVREHAARRSAVVQGVAAIDARPGDRAALRSMLADLADALTSALQLETQDVLREDLLRDDVTVLDATCS